MSTSPITLTVRRSIFIKADPEFVWREFESFERMDRWWGVITGTPEAGKGNGQRLVVYEPRVGGTIRMEVLFGGTPVLYGGSIIVFAAARELTFESDWIPNRGWQHPTLITLRLTKAFLGTQVELLHHGFEQTGSDFGDQLEAYETGWGMTQLSALKKILQ
jgi:hypothetical protein